jgi:hypothetical protein
MSEHHTATNIRSGAILTWRQFILEEAIKTGNASIVM